MELPQDIDKKFKLYCNRGGVYSDMSPFCTTELRSPPRRAEENILSLNWGFWDIFKFQKFDSVFASHLNLIFGFKPIDIIPPLGTL